MFYARRHTCPAWKGTLKQIGITSLHGESQGSLPPRDFLPRKPKKPVPGGLGEGEGEEGGVGGRRGEREERERKKNNCLDILLRLCMFCCIYFTCLYYFALLLSFFFLFLFLYSLQKKKKKTSLILHRRILWSSPIPGYKSPPSVLNLHRIPVSFITPDDLVYTRAPGLHSCF